jgi:hypothetical protein
MNRKIAVAAFAACGLAGVAEATPIYFDFTGTINGSDTAISGGFNFESDRLWSTGEPAGGWQYTFVDWQPVGATLPAAFLSFGGQEISFPRYESHYSLINFADQCSSTPCAPNTADNFNLQAHTSDVWTPDFTGTLRSGMIYVLNYDWTNLDFIDGATAIPTDIVSLPLHSLIGIYSESVQNCVAGSCSVLSDTQIGFSLDTVSRGIGARPVPEPGTLGLLGVALGGILLRRRRIGRQ